MCENIQLIWAVFRMGVYSLFRRICCGGPPPVRPNFTVLCIGLENAGKSSLLAVLSGESTDKIAPTVGFSIKALIFEDCFVDVKELGGGDAVRPYWDKYYLGSQAVIFVVDSACDEATMETTKTEFHKAMDDEQLEGLPLLVLANHQDRDGARSADQISKLLSLDSETDRRQWRIQGCSVKSRDDIEAGFLQLNKLLLSRPRAGKDGEFDNIE